MERQRFIKGTIKNITFRSIAALLAAVLLAVSIPFAAFADPVNTDENEFVSKVDSLEGSSGNIGSLNELDDDFEINFVLLPMGFGNIGFANAKSHYSQDVEAAINFTNGSKTMVKYKTISDDYPVLTTSINLNYSIDLSKRSLTDLTHDNDSLTFGSISGTLTHSGKDYTYTSLWLNGNSSYTFKSKLNEFYKDTDKKYAVYVLQAEGLSPYSSTGTSNSEGYSDSQNLFDDNNKDKVVGSHSLNGNTTTTNNTNNIYYSGNQLSGAVITAAYPHDAGITSGDTQSYTTQATTITATPKGDYVFDHWEKNGTPIGGKASMEVLCNGAIDAYVAVFKPKAEAKGVHVFNDTKNQSEEPVGGTVTGDKSYEGTDTSTVIRAIPDSGWNFDHWECSINGGQKKIVSYSKEYTAPVTNSLDNYYAYFTQEPNGVYTFVSDESHNPVTNGTVSGDAFRNNNGQLTYQTTITATAKKGYVFDHWDLQDASAEGVYREVSKDSTVTVKVNDKVDKYYAVFIPMWDVKTSIALREADGFIHASTIPGVTSGDTEGYVNGQEVKQTTLQAYAKDDQFVFEHWEFASTDQNEEPESGYYTTVSDRNPYTVNIVKPGNSVGIHQYYRAVFDYMWGVSTRITVKGADGSIAPSDIGYTTGDTDGYVNGQEVKQTTLQAYAKDSSFVFDHWELATVIGREEPRDSDYKRVSDSNPINVPITRESGKRKVYRAVFVKKGTAYGVYTTSCDESHNPASYGTVGGDALRNNNGQLTYQTTITASAKRGYVFDHWDLQDAGAEGGYREVSKDSTLTVKVNDSVDNYYAVFVPMWGVKTSASPIEAGYTSGDTDGYVNGQEIKQTTIQATLKSDEYVFSHWKLKNDGSIVSNSISVTVPIKREDEMVEYVAVFEKLSDAFGVTTQPDDPDHGSTTGDTLRKKDGQLIDQTTIQAIPSSNEWVFDHWELSTPGGGQKKVSNANPYNVKVKDQHDVYTAIFISAYGADGVYTEVSDAQCGTTSGDSLRNINGQVVTQTTIEAFPSSNEWVFDYWELKITGEAPVKVSIANPYTVAVDDCVYVYVAHFRARNGITNPEIEIRGHATGITDSVIKKKERLFMVPVLGVDRNYILQLAEQAVQESSSRNDIPPYAGDSPRLSALSAALQLQERKNEEELKDTGFDFVTSDGEIITISDVPVTSVITDAAGTVVEDKYGDIYKSEVIKVSETIVPVTFNDGKRTVIWSNTGAQEDDRLLIIQQGMMFADRNITPIADKDGNIVFSTSDFNGSRFILVKVGYK